MQTHAHTTVQNGTINLRLMTFGLRLMTAWVAVGDALRRGVQRSLERSRDDRGEVTGQTAMIVLLVVAAIAAGTVIASRITENAGRVPSP